MAASLRSSVRASVRALRRVSGCAVGPGLGEADDPAAERARRWLAAAALLALFARGSLVRWELLTASPYPLGVDGYFYPIQVRALLESGHLYYPASPLTFWLMAPLAALTGDPILGAKLGAALGGAAVAWPAYALGKRLGGGRLPGLVAAVVAVSSTGSLLLCAEFVKNAFGVTFGLAGLAALLAALDAPSRRRWALAALAFAAALLTHKMATALVLVLGAPPLGLFAVRRLRARRHGLARAAALIAALAAALVAALIILGALAPGRFLSLAHLELLRGLFAGPWRLEAPALVVGAFVLPLGGEAWQAGAVCLGTLVASVVAHLVPSAARRARPAAAAAPPPASRAARWPLLLLGVLIAWPTLDVEDPQGLAFRLRVIAFVPLALGAALAAGQLLARVSRLAPARAAAAGCAVAAALVVALAAWLVVAPSRLERGVVYAHPAMIAAVQALGSAVPPGEPVVVSERHLAFMATWYTRLPTAVHATGDPARRWRLMPLAFIGSDTPLSRAIDAARRQPALVAPRGLHPKHHNGLVVMPEATWQWVLTQLPPKPRRYYEAWRAL